MSLSDAMPYWAPGLIVLDVLLVLNIVSTKESGLSQIRGTIRRPALTGVFFTAPPAPSTPPRPRQN